MVTLKGIAYRSGNIEFSREMNEWAFRRIDAEMKAGQEDRIKFNPSIAPVELTPYSDAEDYQLPWLEQFQSYIGTADAIYLQKHKGYLRFRRSVHEAGKNKKYITLSGQEEIDAYANERWSKLRYLYATRKNIIRFDISRLLSWKPNDNRRTLPIEINARMELDNSEPTVAFNSSGPNSHVEVVEWRGNIKEGEKRKFLPSEHHIVLMISQMNRPFSFLEEYREDFGNYSYSFVDEKLRRTLDVMVAKRLKAQVQEENLAE